eukprot:scaffold1123_cov168-Amphora_coffeaeformis.AAC.30
MDGLIDNQVVEGPTSIACSDLFQGAVDRASAKGYFASKDNQEVCKRTTAEGSALIIAVKPHIVQAVCADIMAVPSQALIISVAAGVTLETLQTHLPGRRVVRVMPNTPCSVGESASGFAMGSACNDADRATVEAIFGSVGKAFELNEHLLNGVTGVSGSGPAYVFEFIEALADGGVRVGLPRAEALMLAAQTVKGAAEMVLRSGEHPGVLKDRVCSPGGTTIAGVEQLEQGAMRATVINAVKASTRRSMQLGGISEADITSKYNL